MTAAWRPSDAHEPPWPPERASAVTEPFTSPWMDRMLLDALRGIGEDTSIGSPWMKSLIDLRSSPPWEYPRAPADDRVDLSAYTIEGGFFGAPKRETWKYDRVRTEGIVDALAHAYGWDASPPDERDVADAVRDQVRSWRCRYRRDRSEYVYDSLLAPFSQHYQVIMPEYIPETPPVSRSPRWLGDTDNMWFRDVSRRVRREPAFTVMPYFTDDRPFVTTAQDLHQRKPMTEQTKTTAPNQPFPDKLIKAVMAIQTRFEGSLSSDMLAANMNPIFVDSTAAKIVSLRDALKVILDYVPPPPAPVLTLHEQNVVGALLSQSRRNTIQLKRGPFVTSDLWIIPREIYHAHGDKRLVRHVEFAARHNVSLEFAVGVDVGFTGEPVSGSATWCGESFKSGQRVGAAVWSRRAEGFTS